MDPRATTTRQGDDGPHASGNTDFAPRPPLGASMQPPSPGSSRAGTGTSASSSSPFSSPAIKRPDAGLSITTSTSSSSVLQFPGFDLRPPRVSSATTTPSTAPTSATSTILPPLNPNQYPPPSSGSKNKLPRTPQLTVQQSHDYQKPLSIFNMDPKNDPPASTDSDDEPYQAWPRVESWGYTKYKADSSDDSESKSN